MEQRQEETRKHKKLVSELGNKNMVNDKATEMKTITRKVERNKKPIS